MYILKPYDDALEEILKHGIRKSNRTGVDTLAVNGIQKKYNLQSHFPLLTKRKVWPTSVFAELIWFLSGSTNNNDLKALGCNFWTPWVSEEFEKKHGFESGDFGPIYGFQLRHSGGDYRKVRLLEKKIACLQLELNQLRTPKTLTDEARDIIFKIVELQGELNECSGFDQLAYMQNEIRSNPSSRRIMFSLWNMKDFELMRLPPCHFCFQLLLDGNNRLSGILTQRSCDFPVGVPANIQFYSALTILFAKIGGFEPYEFIHNANDCHIYVDQIPAVEEYLSRSEVDSPKLKLIDRKKAVFGNNLINKSSILDYKVEDFIIENYNPQPAIKIPVAV